MKSKVEQLKHSKNKINTFYIKCKNCGKLILPLAGTLNTSDDLNQLCSCDNPESEGVIYIDKIK